MNRIKIDDITQTKILTECKRKCALCVGLSGDYNEKKGQLAHLNKNNSDNKYDNLCFLCFDHHSVYDSTSSQHKNYTINEVKHYRDTLIRELKMENFDTKPSINFNPSKPYYLSFNGINSFIKLNLPDLRDYQEFLVETEFLISNNNYAGVLLCISNSKRDSFLYLVYNSIKHPESPNKLSLKIQKANGEIIDLFSFSDDFTKWCNILIKYSTDSISMTLNERESTIRLPRTKFNFDKIEIGGTSFNNDDYSKSKRQPNYSNSAFRYFKILSNSQLIQNLEFSYGQEYCFKLIEASDVKFYGGLYFANTIRNTI